MPELLDFAELGEGIGDATAVLRSNAASAGLDAVIPSRPGLAVRDLVVEQGVEHRMATAELCDRPAPSAADLRAAASAAGDLLEWLDDGMVDLLNALATAPEDLDVKFFLPDAPPARQAWSRRQCHETTIHAVDAMAARLGRAPRADELWFAPALARDGIDELLLGFAPRRRYDVRYSRKARVTVVTDDDLGAWTLELTPDGLTARVGAEADADTRVTGSARAVYTGLWNRGDEFETAGDPEPLHSFLQQLRVAW